jgi:hypothetical protein
MPLPLLDPDSDGPILIFTFGIVRSSVGLLRSLLELEKKMPAHLLQDLQRSQV